MFTRLLLRFPYLIWLSGLLLPIMYLTYILNLNRVLDFFKKPKPIIILLLIFTILQLVSAFLSIAYDFFTVERLFAVIHNIVAFTFVFLGYAVMRDKLLYDYIKKYSYNVFCWLFILVVIATFLSLYIKKEIVLPSIFTIFNIDNKFVSVKFNMLDWYIFKDFPRTQVMGIYPNSTGLLFIFLYIIIIALNFEELTIRRKVIITLILVFVCFFTGSRAYLLLSSVFFLVLFVKGKSLLSFISLLTPLLIIAVLIAIEYLSELRVGSNNARSMIYLGSFNFMLDTNPIFGLGIKPRLPEIIGVPYPLGSHSTIWGYIIKCGLFGAIFMFIFISIPVFRFIEMLLLQLFTRRSFDYKHFFILSSTMIVIISLGLEDMDAFEILPFYFGMFLWIYNNSYLLHASQKNTTGVSVG